MACSSSRDPWATRQLVKFSYKMSFRFFFQIKFLERVPAAQSNEISGCTGRRVRVVVQTKKLRFPVLENN